MAKGGLRTAVVERGRGGGSCSMSRARWWNGLLERSRRTAMTRITEEWLRENDFVYDSLVVERGYIHVADARSHGHNRFRYAQRKDIRIFVEATWPKRASSRTSASSSTL